MSNLKTCPACKEDSCKNTYEHKLLGDKASDARMVVCNDCGFRCREIDWNNITVKEDTDE